MCVYVCMSVQMGGFRYKYVCLSVLVRKVDTYMCDGVRCDQGLYGYVCFCMGEGDIYICVCKCIGVQVRSVCIVLICVNVFVKYIRICGCQCMVEQVVYK